MIVRYILLALGIYVAYKFVFDLVIPIFRTTQKIRRQFSDVQQQMQDQMKAQQNGFDNRPSQPPPTEQKKSSRAGDYIDFEEVK